MFNKTLVKILCSVILLCVIPFFSSCQGQAGGKIGNKAPNFTLIDSKGAMHTLDDYLGEVIILDFWATWCPPCRMEIPHFQEISEEYKNDGVTVIGVSVDRGGIEVVEPFIQKENVTYPILMAEERVIRDYGGINSIPTTFVIDRKGNIHEKIVGYRNKEFFENIIRKLI